MAGRWPPRVQGLEPMRGVYALYGDRIGEGGQTEPMRVYEDADVGTAAAGIACPALQHRGRSPAAIRRSSLASYGEVRLPVTPETMTMEAIVRHEDENDNWSDYHAFVPVSDA